MRLRILGDLESILLAMLVIVGLTQNPGRSWAETPVTVGGPFTLRGPDGSTVTDQSYRGKWLLVYFGYTLCPDTCPTTLVEISAALSKLGPEAATVQPIFISVDSEHDNYKVMRDYTASIDPRIAGLAGTPREIETVTDEYGAFFQKRWDDPGKQSYSYDHSIYVYVMDPSGRFVRAFDADWSADRMAVALHDLMAHFPETRSDNRAG